MKKSTRTTTAAAAVLIGVPALALGTAMPATAADRSGEQSSSSSVSGSVSVNFDVVAVGNAIKDAVNDQSDRGGAVRAALDVAGAQSGVNVSVVNKNQDISSSGHVWAEHIDIKGGNYVVYFYDREGTLENNGDGGWINWGFLGTFERDDNRVEFH